MGIQLNIRFEHNFKRKRRKKGNAWSFQSDNYYIYICICIYVFAFVCELYHYLENASHDDGHIRTQIENITLLLSPAQSAPFLFLLLLFFIMVIIPSWKNAGENSDRFRSSPLIIRILAVDSDWKDMCSQSRRVVWDHGTDRDTKVTIVLSISPVKRYRSNTDTKRAMVVGGFLWYHGGLVHGLVN